jgi:sugar/nucleoside kinase (ribokinase family)
MVHAVIYKYSGPNTQIILNLIDTEITTHQRQTIHALIKQKKLNYIICNAEEMMALFDTDLDSALKAASAVEQIFIVTLGRQGAIVIDGANSTKIDPIFVAHEDISDLIGAGDQFAAGFIAGIAAGKTIQESCRLGTQKASEILVVEGARPHTNEDQRKNHAGRP